MTVRNYVIRRMLIMIPTFFLISLVIFILIHLAPGDPAQAMFGGRHVSPLIIERLKIRLGLDQPLPVQYLLWLSRLLQGDFGYSFLREASVTSLIAELVPRTLLLVVTAELLALVFGIILGVIAAVKHGSLVEAATSVGALIGYSIPNFWIALMSILVFALWLGWFPVGGLTTLGPTFTPLEALRDHLWHLILPASVLAFGWTAYLLRLVRSSMLEVLRQDYITTARAKGLKERVVIYKHALRNALLPVVTYVGFSLGFILGGAVVIEQVFSWLGLGHFFVDVAMKRDYPLLMGISMIIALMILIANLCADITYAIVDPRIRYD